MSVLEQLGNTDIYLIDQILKSRYNANDVILDAGCGRGRNIKWFYNQGYKVYAIDKDEDSLHELISTYPELTMAVKGELDYLPFKDEIFNHVICSAVLHFAESEAQFKQQFSELVRVLKPEGTFFIRMTTDVGVEQTITHQNNGVYYLKDDSYRFLITRELLNYVVKEHNLQLIEPFKTTVVEDLRSMATIVLQKM